jgi:hypothetical protein
MEASLILLETVDPHSNSELEKVKSSKDGTRELHRLVAKN